MKTTKIINNNPKTKNITELFGLPKAGKSTFHKEFLKQNKNYSGINFKEISSLKKFFYFLKFSLKNPSSTAYLFYKLNTNWITFKKLTFYDYIKIFTMRNSYLVAVLSKYELTKDISSPLLLDEFLLQSLFMIKQKPSHEKELRKILKSLPKSNQVILIEENLQKLHERWKNIKIQLGD